MWPTIPDAATHVPNGAQCPDPAQQFAPSADRPRPMAFLYVDPFGRDLAALRTRMREVGRARILIWSRKGRPSIFSRPSPGTPMTRDHARLAVSDLLGVGSRAKADARILEAIRCMRDAPGRAHRLTELGKRAGLSPSRFLHLFKAETGVPLRRYRIWNRIGAASRAIAGGPLADRGRARRRLCKLGAFQHRFRDMFGMTPSELFARLGEAGALQPSS